MFRRLIGKAIGHGPDAEIWIVRDQWNSRWPEIRGGKSRDERGEQQCCRAAQVSSFHSVPESKVLDDILGTRGRSALQ